MAVRRERRFDLMMVSSRCRSGLILVRCRSDQALHSLARCQCDPQLSETLVPDRSKDDPLTVRRPVARLLGFLRGKNRHWCVLAVEVDLIEIPLCPCEGQLVTGAEGRQRGLVSCTKRRPAAAPQVEDANLAQRVVPFNRQKTAVTRQCWVAILPRRGQDRQLLPLEVVPDQAPEVAS